MSTEEGMTERKRELRSLAASFCNEMTPSLRRMLDWLVAPGELRYVMWHVKASLDTHMMLAEDMMQRQEERQRARARRRLSDSE